MEGALRAEQLVVGERVEPAGAKRRASSAPLLRLAALRIVRVGVQPEERLRLREGSWTAPKRRLESVQPGARLLEQRAHLGQQRGDGGRDGVGGLVVQAHGELDAAQLQEEGEEGPLAHRRRRPPLRVLRGGDTLAARRSSRKCLGSV